MTGYIFGGNTGLTYEELRRRREAQARRRPVYPKTFGGGLAALGGGLAALWRDIETRRAEQRNQEEFRRTMQEYYRHKYKTRPSPTQQPPPRTSAAPAAVHPVSAAPSHAAPYDRRLDGLEPSTRAAWTALKAKFPAIIGTSFRRPPARNRAVGGARNSQHLQGRAFDFNVPVGLGRDKLKEIVKYARSKGVTSGGYYGVSNGHHSLHFDTRPDGQAVWGHDTTRQTAPSWWVEAFAEDLTPDAAAQVVPAAMHGQGQQTGQVMPAVQPVQYQPPRPDLRMLEQALNPRFSPQQQRMLLQLAQSPDPTDRLKFERLQIDNEIRRAELEKARRAPDRKYDTAADGYQYYLDTGERVFPDVTQGPKLPPPSPGYMYQPSTAEGEPPSMVPIPGGPAARKIAEQNEKKSLRREKTRYETGLVLREIDRAIDLINKSTTRTMSGQPGAMVQYIGGTDAFDLRKRLEMIESNIGFTKLKEMREASATGASGLGQVTEKEHRLLQTVYGSIDLRQSTRQLLFNLKRLKEVFSWAVHGPIGGQAAGVGGGAQAGAKKPDRRFR